MLSYAGHFYCVSVGLHLPRWFDLWSHSLRLSSLWKCFLLFCVRLCNSMVCGTPGFPRSSPSPGVCSDSSPLSWWCHPTISFSVVCFSSCLQSFPALEPFPMSRLLASGGLSIWNFSISPCSVYSELISFRIDWSSCRTRDSQEFSLAPQFKSVNSLVPSLLNGSTFTSIHDYWKNHSFDYMDLCWQSDVSAF